MKKTVLFMSAFLLIALAFITMKLALDQQTTFEGNNVVSSDAKNNEPLPLTQKPEQSVLAPENQQSEDKATANNSIVSSDNSSNEELVGGSSFNSEQQDSRTEKAFNTDVISPYAFLPDGRIFTHGEPPYGYLPTEYAKGNLTLPLLPLEPGE